MAVFVLDQQKKPLMPCSEKRARLLLSGGRAVVHRRMPFVIRLKDQKHASSRVQEVALKLDPGSKTTGIALARVEHTETEEIHHALHLAHLSHRGEVIHQRLSKRAGYRRRRRSANLRYRPPRFQNCRRAKGWLHPSLRSHIGNVRTWARRYQRWLPLARLEVERVKFDLALLQNPEIAGLEYQRGELAGWEVRCYLLEKFGRRCVYCGRGETAFEIEHVVPRSRGGSDRVSNLVLACHDCNQMKGKQTAAEFGYGASRQAIWYERSFHCPSRPQGCMWGGSQCRHPVRFASARSMGSMSRTAVYCNVRMATSMDNFDWQGQATPCPEEGTPASSPSLKRGASAGGTL